MLVWHKINNSALLLTCAIKLEKAEILEKTISYIKKLQDLTGDMKAGVETENSDLNGENTNYYIALGGGGGGRRL